MNSPKFLVMKNCSVTYDHILIKERRSIIFPVNGIEITIKFFAHKVAQI